jgi:hypothetical protein
MATTVTLSKRSGERVITIDLYQITHTEWVSLWEDKTPLQTKHEIVARVSGLTADELIALPQGDYMRIVRGLTKANANPLDDPS